MDGLFHNSKLLWKPQNPSSTRVEALRRAINHKHNLNLKDYHDLYQYSIDNYGFWIDLAQFLGITFSVSPSRAKIIEPGRLDVLPTWFPGARLNFAEILLSRNHDGIAVTSARETGTVAHFSWKELRERVRKTAAAMRRNGLKVGDRVAAVITNSIDAVVIALATASAGAIFSSTATDMGVQGILDRYRQITPKFIFAETEVVYAGKAIDLIPKVREVAKDLISRQLERVILLPSSKTGGLPRHDVPQSISFDEFLGNDDADGGELRFEQLPFNHPLFILYSSGTSGPPKCIVHSAGGVLLQCMKDGGIGFGFTPDDTYFQYTTTGWMMWTAMINALAAGTRIIAYDGSPFHPDLKTFLKFVSDERVSVLGVGPRFLTEIQGQGINPLELAPFESLRIVFSTGAVLTPHMFEFVQKAFGDVHIASGSGGTDICAAFVSQVPTLPVYTGEIQGKALGMKVEVFDPDGRNIEHTGEAGELVCTRPHPSLPLGFWGDDDGSKLLNAYFSFYPGIWRQGDFMAVNPRTKGILILGRSDGVLNPSGVRFGSGEIYGVMERFSKYIDDSLCIGQRRPEDKDERVLLFVKMRPSFSIAPSLEGEIRKAIRETLSARHVPAYIFEVEDIPYTVNNKKVEIAVKQIVSGATIKPSGTVANPESLKLYYKYRDLGAKVQEKSKL
ncbi:acetoacetyl-CoA synthetase [Rickenella mellea]|uniref:Acetoacetyl-CoA synthetase n=1 Tax=Rickenella mellea TaxID=50990 RepID=A0A4Y7Q9E3_9AGAM|nr:acetoacetyl-CoA synthetase [Rickenella mellea]